MFRSLSAGGCYGTSMKYSKSPTCTQFIVQSRGEASDWSLYVFTIPCPVNHALSLLLLLQSIATSSSNSKPPASTYQTIGSAIPKPNLVPLKPPHLLPSQFLISISHFASTTSMYMTVALVGYTECPDTPSVRQTSPAKLVDAVLGLEGGVQIHAPSGGDDGRH